MLATLLCAAMLSLFAKKIYVSSSTGNDALPVLAAGDSTTPWKSWYRVQRAGLQPGDTVLLKRGDVFQEMVWLYGSGTAEAPILVGAWGDGAAPVVDGGDELENWVMESEGVWVHPWAGSVPALFHLDLPLPMARWPGAEPAIMEEGTREDRIATSFSGVDLTGAAVLIRNSAFGLTWGTVTAMWDSGATVLAQKGGAPKGLRPGLEFWATGHPAFLTAEGQWVWNETEVRLRSSTQPAKVFTTAKKYGIRIVSGDHWIIQDLEVRRVINYGLLIDGSHITVRNLQLSDIGQSGIYVAEGADILIENCSMRNLASNGIESYGSDVRIRGGRVENIQLDPLWPGGMRTSAAGTGITVRGANSEVRGVELRNIGYDGIKSTGPDAVIVGNRIENHTRTLQDGGGIYLAGLNTAGSRVDSNLIETAPASDPEVGTYLMVVAAIYFDERTRHSAARDNRIIGGGRGIFLHNASDNLIAGNWITDYSYYGISMDQDGAARDSLRDNTVEFNRIDGGGLALIRLKKATGPTSPGIIDRNAFGVPRTEARFIREDPITNRWGAVGWETWSSEGFDLGSSFAD